MGPQYAQKSDRCLLVWPNSTVKLLPSNSAMLTLRQPWRAGCAALLAARLLPLRAAHLLFPWPRAPQPLSVTPLTHRVASIRLWLKS